MMNLYQQGTAHTDDSTAGRQDRGCQPGVGGGPDGGRGGDALLVC